MSGAPIKAGLIYFVRQWRWYEGEEIMDLGMITTDKVKAEAFCEKHEGFKILEVEDGDEYPGM